MKQCLGRTALQRWASHTLLSDSAAKWNPESLVLNQRCLTCELSKKSEFRKEKVTIYWMLLSARHLHIFTSSINSVTLSLSLFRIKGTGIEIIWPKSKPGVPLIVGDFKPLPLIAWLRPWRRKGGIGLEPDDNYCMREEQFYVWACYTYSLMSCAWQSKVEWEEYILVSVKSPLEQIQLPTKKSTLGCSKPNVPELAGEKFPGE